MWSHPAISCLNGVDLSEPKQALFAIFRSGEDGNYSTKISENSRARNASKRDQG